MATFKSTPVASDVKNSIDNQTFSKWRGLGVVKKKINENTSETLPQQQQRARMATAYKLCRLLAPASAIGFPRRPQVQDANNTFMSLNTRKKVLTVGTDRDEDGNLEVTVNFPQIRCAKGWIILPEGLTATKNTESHTLTFTHEAEEDGTDMHASDKLYALVVETARWNSKLFELNTRADGEPAEVSLPAKWDMDALEVYVFALTEDGNTASDSMYLTVEEGS